MGFESLYLHELPLLHCRCWPKSILWILKNYKYSTRERDETAGTVGSSPILPPCLQHGKKGKLCWLLPNQHQSKRLDKARIRKMLLGLVVEPVQVSVLLIEHSFSLSSFLSYCLAKGLHLSHFTHESISMREDTTSKCKYGSGRWFRKTACQPAHPAPALCG